MRDFDGPLEDLPWNTERSPPAAHVRSALVLSLLTEDNLPSCHTQLITELGREGARGEWAHRWTAEVSRNSTALRGSLHVTRGRPGCPGTPPHAAHEHRLHP
ncbi:acyl-ACP desaturase [Streptomyces virginiae]|uniref:acyl-ACP desaturase n=1 Tax=Streptomyces virginiae TaxID=1961 RepID=UPI0035D5A893